jgi:uncharacterized paraquat-inducible protein A
MDSNNLRAALRSGARKRLAGFLAAALLLCLVLRTGATLRAELIATLGERVFFWGLGVGTFAAILVPQIVVERAVQRDRRQYCPKCGKFLARIRAALRLNKHGDCLYCGVDLGVQQPTRLQILADIALIFCSLLVLMLFSRLIL